MQADGFDGQRLQKVITFIALFMASLEIIN